MKTHKIRNTIFLFLTAMIWGAAFVAQSVSMDFIGPFTFICLRSIIGGLFLIPVIMVIDGIRVKNQKKSANNPQKLLEERQKLSWKNKKLLESGIVCGIFLFLANCFQQTGIQYTTVGKAGFITTFYIKYNIKDRAGNKDEKRFYYNWNHYICRDAGGMRK